MWKSPLEYPKEELDTYKERFFQELMKLAPDWGEARCREEADNVPYSCWSDWKKWGVPPENLAREALM